LAAFIVDEQRNVCKGGRVGVFMRDEFYPADEANGGLIVLPYINLSTNAILVDNDFSDIVNSVTLPSQSVQLGFNLLFNEEGIFSNNLAKFVLQPKLAVNGLLLPLDLLDNPKVNIHVTNDIGIANNTLFDSLKLSYSEDTVLRYMVPPKTKNITISMTAKFKKADGSEQNLSVQRSLNLFRSENHQYLASLHMVKRGQDHVL
jgi:hypothetical protein